ncbi:hypothetical protein GW764_00995 [Candidatus Parcubacteria bacterium]|nr:hypothetical protein [Candidatus Parcubacteria bacterium]
MENSNKDEIKKLTLSRVLAYVLGGLFLLAGVTSLFSNFMVGVVFIVISIVLFPPLYKLLESKTKVRLSKSLRVVTTIILLGVAGALFSSSEVDSIVEKVNQESTNTVTENVSPVKEEYTEVITLKGKGNQNSASFNVTGKKVRLTATTTGGSSGIGTFSGIELKKEEGGYVGQV